MTSPIPTLDDEVKPTIDQSSLTPDLESAEKVNAEPVEIQPFTAAERVPSNWSISPTDDPEINTFKCVTNRELVCTTQEFNQLMKV